MTIWVLTGRIGAGKTTALRKIVSLLAKRGLKLAGVLSPSVSDRGGDRIGYDHVTFEATEGRLRILLGAPFLRKGAPKRKNCSVEVSTSSALNQPRGGGEAESFLIPWSSVRTSRKEPSRLIYRNFIGPYRINRKVLRFTASCLAGSARKKDLDLLVIDELGYLELKGNGFYRALGEAVERGVSLLVVVRRELLGKVLALPPLRKEKKHIFRIERDRPHEVAKKIGG